MLSSSLLLSHVLVAMGTDILSIYYLPIITEDAKLLSVCYLPNLIKVMESQMPSFCQLILLTDTELSLVLLTCNLVATDSLCFNPTIILLPHVQILSFSLFLLTHNLGATDGELLSVRLSVSSCRGSDTLRRPRAVHRDMLTQTKSIFISFAVILR